MAVENEQTCSTPLQIMLSLGENELKRNKDEIVQNDNDAKLNRNNQIALFDSLPQNNVLLTEENRWMQSKDECPDCLAHITSFTKVVALDNLRDRIVSQFNERMKQKGAEHVSVRKFKQSLFAGTAAHRPSAAKINKRTELETSRTRTSSLNRRAALKSASARRAAVVGTDANSKTLALKRTAELTRSAALRRTQAAVRFAPLKKAAGVAQIASVKGGTTQRTKSKTAAITIGNTKVTATRAATNIDTAASRSLATTAAVDTSATERATVKRTVRSTALRNSKSNKNSSYSDDEETDSCSSDHESGSSYTSSDGRDDSQDDIDDDLYKLRRGDRLSLNNDDKGHMEDDYKQE